MKKKTTKNSELGSYLFSVFRLRISFIMPICLLKTHRGIVVNGRIQDFWKVGSNPSRGGLVSTFYLIFHKFSHEIEVICSQRGFKQTTRPACKSATGLSHLHGRTGVARFIPGFSVCFIHGYKTSLYFMSCVVRKPIFANAKTKAQISFTVTAKLISTFVFATRIVQSLFFLNLKFQASNPFLSGLA